MPLPSLYNGNLYPLNTVYIVDWGPGFLALYEKGHWCGIIYYPMKKGKYAESKIRLNEAANNKFAWLHVEYDYQYNKSN